MTIGYLRAGTDVWLHKLWNCDFAHGTELVEAIQSAAYGKYFTEPVDADMAIDKLMAAGWITRFDHPPCPTFSMRVWCSYGRKYTPSSCHYGYTPVRESGLREWIAAAIAAGSAR